MTEPLTPSNEEDNDRQLDVQAVLANAFIGTCQQGILRVVYGERLRNGGDLVIHGGFVVSLSTAVNLRDMIDTLLTQAATVLEDSGMTRQ